MHPRQILSLRPAKHGHPWERRWGDKDPDFFRPFVVFCAVVVILPFPSVFSVSPSAVIFRGPVNAHELGITIRILSTAAASHNRHLRPSHNPHIRQGRHGPHVVTDTRGRRKCFVARRSPPVRAMRVARGGRGLGFFDRESKCVAIVAWVEGCAGCRMLYPPLGPASRGRVSILPRRGIDLAVPSRLPPH